MFEWLMETITVWAIMLEIDLSVERFISIVETLPLENQEKLADEAEKLLEKHQKKNQKEKG